MATKSKKDLMWVSLLGVLIFCLFLWYAKTELRFSMFGYTEVHSENGVWDLSEIDFDNTVVRLTGNVEHIEHAILNPQQFELHKDEIEIGDPIDVFESRTARLTVMMPDSGYYRLLTTGDYARNVYINGELRGSIGEPTNSELTFKPAFGEVSADAKAQNNMFTLVVNGANFVHRGGTSYTQTIIGTSENVTKFLNMQTAIEMLMVGIFFGLFVVHMLFAAVLKNKSINFFFALLCLTFALRVSLVGTKVLYNIIPNIPWEVAIRLEYMSVGFAGALVICLLYLQFKKCIGRAALYITVFGLCVLCAAFLFMETYVSSQLILWVNVANGAAIMYCTVSIIIWIVKKHKNKEKISRSHTITFASFMFFSAAVVFDSLYYAGIKFEVMNDTLSEIAMLAFAMYEALAIFYITMLSARAVKTTYAEAQNSASIAVQAQMGEIVQESIAEADAQQTSQDESEK